MKKIYIKENQIKKELLLPKFLFKAVKDHETSLGDNPAFPGEDDYPFDYTILKERYNDVCLAMKDVGVEITTTDQLTSLLSALVALCKEYEKPVRDALERVCENAVNKMFAIPEGALNMKCKLVDKITYKTSIGVTPEASSESKYKFKDIDEKELSKKAIAKRRFINSLIMGASGSFSSCKLFYESDIAKINEKLPVLYDKIMAINEYLLFTTEEEISDEKPKQGSYVEVHVGSNGNRSNIEAQGVIFPLLLHDTIKGLFELFSVYGLPKDRDKAKYIISKADFILAEPWDMRLGVKMWDMIFGGIGDFNIIPYVFMELVSLNTDEFNLSMKEILAGTAKGEDIMKTVLSKASYNSGYQEFKKRINLKNVDKSMIADSYFTAAELDGFELDGEEDGDVIQEDIITESQESKSISAAKKLVMQKFGYDEQEADEFIRIKLRNDIPTLRTPQGGKFILGVTRMFCDGELRNANDIGNLNSTLKLVASDAHINEYDRNLNGMSCQELIQRFAKAMSDNLEAEKAEINQMVFDTPSDYEIVRIDSFEQAEEYGDYVSWCVTHDEGMFDSYTSNGINQFYFCLKNGFENVDEQPGDGCPLDEYGLSMIAVSVNENGMLNTCTCRWNHDNGGDDSIMNSKEVSQVIGMNFFDVFKPNNKWNELISSTMERLARGENPADVFDYYAYTNLGLSVVGFEELERYNVIDKENNFISDKWYVSIKLNNIGLFIVEDSSYKKSYMNLNGNVISEKYNNIEIDTYDGLAIVRRDGKYNWIKPNGERLNNDWYNWVGNFKYGPAQVGSEKGKNFVNTNGELMCKRWYNDIHSMTLNKDGTMVTLGNKTNYIDANGNEISSEWFDGGFYRFNYGFVGVFKNYGNNVTRANFIDTKGNLLCDKWFDSIIKDFNGNGIAEVTDEHEMLYTINRRGKITNTGKYYGDWKEYSADPECVKEEVNRFNALLYYLMTDGRCELSCADISFHEWLIQNYPSLNYSVYFANGHFTEFYKKR